MGSQHIILDADGKIGYSKVNRTVKDMRWFFCIFIYGLKECSEKYRGELLLLRKIIEYTLFSSIVVTSLKSDVPSCIKLAVHVATKLRDDRPPLISVIDSGFNTVNPAE